MSESVREPRLCFHEVGHVFGDLLDGGSDLIVVAETTEHYITTPIRTNPPNVGPVTTGVRGIVGGFVATLIYDCGDRVSGERLLLGAMAAHKLYRSNYVIDYEKLSKFDDREIALAAVECVLVLTANLSLARAMAAHVASCIADGLPAMFRSPALFAKLKGVEHARLVAKMPQLLVSDASRTRLFTDFSAFDQPTALDNRHFMEKL
jgi:hypothetical protein